MDYSKFIPAYVGGKTVTEARICASGAVILSSGSMHLGLSELPTGVEAPEEDFTLYEDDLWG